MKKYFLNINIIVSIVFLGLFTLCSVSYGAGSTFETRLSVIADDYTAPTIPTGLVATTLSSTQINLVWDASTDDVAVAGYRIFRDGGIIASTTSLFYQDNGLTASTSYSYTVGAFDSVPRYSGESSLAYATTTAAPVASPSPTVEVNATSTSGSNSGSAGLNIYNLFVTTSDTFGVIDFKTNQPSQAKVFWGKTSDYEIGSVSGLFYEISHSVNIKDLEPNTKYFYKIEVLSSSGRVVSYQSFFQTRKSAQESLLTNVQNFKAIPLENSIALDWNNPSSVNFDSVRLIKSDKFFPRDIFDGEAIYEGIGESYQDRDVKIGKTYYYSIFAKDINGTYSSGALAQARIKPDGEVEIFPKPTDPFDGIDVLKNVDQKIAQLSLIDFDFIQDGKKLFSEGNNVIIDGSKNLTISLGYEKIPEILKTIAFTLIDPEDSTKIFPFLLRVNKDKTAYEATIAPLGKSGKYEMKIIILDYKNQGLKRLEGSLQAFVLDKVEEFARNYRLGNIFGLFGILLLISSIIYSFKMHLKHEKK
jgi:chitodextrinase